MFATKELFRDALNKVENNAQRVREGLEPLSPAAAVAWQEEREAARINAQRAEAGLEPAATLAAARAWFLEHMSVRAAVRINERREREGLPTLSPGAAAQ